VEVAASFDAEKSSLADLDALRTRFAAPPGELDAMRVLAVLGKGDVKGAVAAADALLARMSGVLAARMAAMTVFHVCAIGNPERSAEREFWIGRRNDQLDWLLQRTYARESHELWARMRSTH
jgi:hypothetical protein